MCVLTCHKSTAWCTSVHTTSLTMQCQGVTSIGPRCKRVTHSVDGFCCQHKTQTPIPLYPVMDNWPVSGTIKPYVLIFHSVHRLVDVIKTHHRLLEMVVVMSQTETGKNYEKRKCVIISIELIKANINLVYDNPGMQKLVAALASKLDQFPEFAEYAEDFRRKCLKSHREAARKRLIAFYFNRCEDLCDDMIWEIMNRV
jgi:hypothetical protein